MITFLKKNRKIYFFKVCLNIELSVSNCQNEGINIGERWFESVI